MSMPVFFTRLASPLYFAAVSTYSSSEYIREDSPGNIVVPPVRMMFYMRGRNKSISHWLRHSNTL